MKRFRDIKEFASVFAKTSGLLHHLYENRDGEGTEYGRAVELLCRAFPFQEVWHLYWRKK